MKKSNMDITTNIGCSNNCAICPQKILIHRYKQFSNIMMMNMDVFKTCIDKLPKDMLISFAGFSEPWLNSVCTDMVEYVYNKNMDVGVYTTLTGMGKNDITRLGAMRFFYFLVHLPNILDCFYRDKQQYLFLLDMICKKIDGLNFIFFYNLDEDIKNLIENHGYNIKPSNLQSRAGNLFKLPMQKGSCYCDSPFKYFHILLPNGDVTLCCMDFGLKHILGNLLVDSFDDLHKKQEWLRVKKNMRQPIGGDIICRECDLFTPYISLRFMNKMVSNFFNWFNGGRLF